MSKEEKVLDTDGELGQMEIDYVKVYQRHPEEDGHTEICAASTYPTVGTSISGPDMLCEEATYTISPSTSSGSWGYSSVYLHKTAETSGSITLEKDYPYPYDYGYVTYKYSNGVPGCPVRSISKMVKCPLSYVTPIFIINAFDINGNFRFHLVSDVYDKIDVNASINPEISWTIHYNANEDNFNPQTAQVYHIKGQYALSPILHLDTTDKYNIKWDVVVKYANDSLIFSGNRNSKSPYLQQQNDTNVTYFDAHLPSLQTFDSSIMKIVETTIFTEQEADDTIFVKDRIDKMKIKALEPYLYYGNNQAMMKQQNIDDNINKSIVYPNPSSNTIRIQLADTFRKDKAVHYKIYSIEGRLILENELDNEIDISKLASGMYIIELTQNNNTLETIIFSVQ